MSEGIKIWPLSVWHKIHEEKAMSKHVCHAEGCEIPVPPRMLMCRRHWRQVPRLIQAQIWRYYRPGQEIDKRPSAEYLRAMKAAIDAVKQRNAVKRTQLPLL